MTDSLFIGDIKLETDNNLWSISASSKLISTLTIEELADFIERVISNRKEQVDARKSSAKMMFYLWFDAQASQIRFNVISDYKAGLPFGCKVIRTDDYKPILSDFLKHPYHDGIPHESFADVYSEEGYIYLNQDYSLKVYCVEL